MKPARLVTKRWLSPSLHGGTVATKKATRKGKGSTRTLLCSSTLTQHRRESDGVSELRVSLTSTQQHSPPPQLHWTTKATQQQGESDDGMNETPGGIVVEEKIASQKWGSQTWEHLTSLRGKSPLIQCITNFVSMDIMANVLLSAGASPAMVHSIDEIPEFTPKSDALCVNVGTLTPDWLPAMKAAAETANKEGKPWVLDPVAAGATSFRLKACLELLELKPTVVRGNGSEILALFGASVDATSKGVDSRHESRDVIEAAKSLALATGIVVAVSGAVDIVTDGNRVVGIQNGVPMLQKITATGCAVTALIAAFLAIDPMHVVEATASALCVFGVVSEIGMSKANGPASLRTNLIDVLYTLDQINLIDRGRISDL